MFNVQLNTKWVISRTLFQPISRARWWLGVAVALLVARTKLLHAEPGMGDRLQAGIPPRYVTKPTGSTQLCIPPGSLNRVPALVGWEKDENVGWQVTLRDIPCGT